MFMRIDDRYIFEIESQAIIVTTKTSTQVEDSFAIEDKQKEKPFFINIGYPGDKDDFKIAIIDAIKETIEKRYNSITIPVTTDTYNLFDETVSNLMVEVFNTDLSDDLLKILLKPEEDILNEIVFVVDNIDIYKQLKHLLALTKRWPKYRKLAFVLDALNLNLIATEVCNRHFIPDSNFMARLIKFSKECQSELIKRAENIAIQKHGEEAIRFQQISDKLSEINCLTQKDINLIKFLDPEILDRPTIEFFRSLQDLNHVLREINPLYYYINHLIPDEKWRRIKPFMKSKKRKVMDTIEHDKEKINQDYQHLLKIITKTGELKETIFPVDMLSRFWDKQTWKEIMGEKIVPSKIAIGLVMEYYDASPDTINGALYRK